MSSTMVSYYQQSCQWDERRERPGRILVVALEGHHSVVRLGPLRATVVLFRRRLTMERPAVIWPYVTSYAVWAGERVHIVHVVNREGRCAMGSVATTPHSPQHLEGFGVTDIYHFYFFRN